VLRTFGKQELAELDQILERAAEVVELFMAEGVDKAMAVANRRA
jgi:peptidyl-tRNA hydrolase